MELPATEVETWFINLWNHFVIPYLMGTIMAGIEVCGCGWVCVCSGRGGGAVYYMHARMRSLSHPINCTQDSVSKLHASLDSPYVEHISTPHLDIPHCKLRVLEKKNKIKKQQKYSRGVPTTDVNCLQYWSLGLDCFTYPFPVSVLVSFHTTSCKEDCS